MGGTTADAVSSVGDSLGLGDKGTGAAIGGAIFGPTGALIGGAIGQSGIVEGLSDPLGNKEAERRRLEEAQGLRDAEVTTRGTTDQTTTTTGATSQVSQTLFDPVSAQEQALQDASISAFNRARGLAGGIEEDIAARGALQGQGRGVLGDIASGAAFAATPEEQARIGRLRESELAIGEQQVGSFLDQRLAALESDAQRRGLRGQAFTQLQGDVLGEASQSIERQTLEANRLAAERESQFVGQRTGLQANVGGQLSDFQTRLQQQALANQQSLQDPAALRALREERLAGGRTVSTGRTQQTGRTRGTTTGVEKGRFAGQAAQLAAGPTAGQQNVADIVSIGGTVASGLGAVL